MPDIVERLREVLKLNGDTYTQEEVLSMMRQAADEIDGLREWNAWFAAHNTELKKKNVELLASLERATDLLRDALNVIGVQNDWTVPYQEIRKFIDETDDAAPTT